MLSDNGHSEHLPEFDSECLTGLVVDGEVDRTVGDSKNLLQLKPNVSKNFRLPNKKGLNFVQFKIIFSQCIQIAQKYQNGLIIYRTKSSNANNF